LYKTNQGLKDVAAQHPDNKLLAGRGPPGTHDSELATRVLDAVKTIASGSIVELPIFDKSLCGGEGDRSKDTVKVQGPLDVFILEGWSMGFGPLAKEEIEKRYQSKTSQSDTSYFLDQPLSSLVTLNNYLADFATKVYAPFETIVQIEPESHKYVFEWRLEQERNMKAANGGKGMTDEQVEKFVERYMPGYELWKEGIWDQGCPWAGRGLRLWYGKSREIIKVDSPKAKSVEVPEVETKAINGNEPKVEAISNAVGETAKPARAVVGETSQKPTTQAVSAAPERVDVPAASPTSAPAPSKASSTSTPGGISTPKTRYNPNWSRKFLAAKAPLIPTYDQIPSLSTLHQDSQVLKATSHLVFFPIQGPGGRIGVHPLAKKGRMTNGGEGYLSGGIEVSDFAVEAFEDETKGTRVALAGEDGVVRVWKVGQHGVEGTGPEPDQVLKGQLADAAPALGCC
jgi:hypothetical protein